MGMTELQHTWCRRILNDLKKKKTSNAFRRPFQEIFTLNTTLKIKKHVDLTIIEKKLMHNEYSDITKFVLDMKLMWKNALESFSPDSLIHQTALYLSSWVEKKYGEYPRNEKEEWLNMIKVLTKKVQKLEAQIPQ